MDYALTNAPLSPKEDFLGFEIEALIGHGGSAWVYRVRNRLTQERFALKLIRNLPDSDLRDRTRDEYQILQRLQHPHVVRVYAAGLSSDQKFLYILMELLEGLPLREIASVLRTLTVPEILRLGDELCDAAHAAHCMGVVHRDLKPENIFVRWDDVAKVLDFGVAKLFGPRNVPTGPRWRGTLLYMSPEQLRGEPCTPASDVYAIGLILYELLAGTHFCRQYHAAPSLQLVAQFQLYRRPVPLRKQVPNCPRELSDIIERATEKDAAKRFQTAAEMRRSLCELAVSLETKSRQRGDVFSRRALVAEVQRQRQLNTQNQGLLEEISPLEPTKKGLFVQAAETVRVTIERDILVKPKALLREWRVVGPALLLSSLIGIPAGWGVSGALARMVASEPNERAHPYTVSSLGEQTSAPAVEWHTLPRPFYGQAQVDRMSRTARMALVIADIRPQSSLQPRLPAPSAKASLASAVSLAVKPTRHAPTEATSRLQPAKGSRSVERAQRSVQARSAVDLLDLFTPERRLMPVSAPPRPEARPTTAVLARPQSERASSSSDIIDPWAGRHTGARAHKRSGK